jgi:cytochrome b subunit of formate dehydrogenase
MAGAFALLSFLIVHVYMTTTGHTITAHLAAMVSGYDEVPQDYEAQEWEWHDLADRR